MPLPLTVSCFSKIQIGFTFLVPAHPGSSGRRAVKWVCVCTIIIFMILLHSKPLLLFGICASTHCSWPVINECLVIVNFYTLVVIGSKNSIFFHFVGRGRVFWLQSPQNLKEFRWNLEHKCGTTVRSRRKKLLETNTAKTYFVFLWPIKGSLSDTYPAPIPMVFELTDVNRCVGAYTHEKFPNFCVGVLHALQKLPQKQYFGLGACYQHTAKAAQFWAIEGLADIPSRSAFCSWWGCAVWALWPPEDVLFIISMTPCSLISGSRKVLCKKLDDHE